MMKKNLITFVGNGSYGNRGCEAIIRGSVNILGSVFPDYSYYNAYFPDIVPDKKDGIWDKKITYIPLDKGTLRRQLFSPRWWNYKLQEKIAPENAKNFRYRAARHAIIKSSAVAMVGGDNYSLDYGYPSIFFQLNEFAYSLGKPVVLWGASVGPFSKDPSYEKYAANELRKVTRIYARESITVDYLRSIGIESNVIRVSDPAFFMEPEERVFPTEIENKLVEGAIGINLSPLMGRFLDHSNQADWIDQAKEIIVKITSEIHLPVVLIPHVTFNSPDNKNDDYVFMRRIYDSLSGDLKQNIVLMDRYYNAAETKFLISKLKAFIGARTHSTIASLSSAVPTLVLGYSIKGKGIIRDLFDNDQWVLEHHQINSSDILGKLIKLLDSQESIRLQLASRLPKIREQSLKAAFDLKDFLSSR